MIIGVGIDVVEIARFEQALNRPRGLSGRLFTDGERILPPHSLAARFAAKEALAKALGAPRGLLWTDAEVVTDDRGRPSLQVHGTVAADAGRLGVTGRQLGLSHAAGIASAVVIAESDSQAGLGWV